MVRIQERRRGAVVSVSDWVIGAVLPGVSSNYLHGYRCFLQQ